MLHGTRGAVCSGIASMGGTDFTGDSGNVRIMHKGDGTLVIQAQEGVESVGNRQVVQSFNFVHEILPFLVFVNGAGIRLNYVKNM